jgi:hypothetical protein
MHPFILGVALQRAGQCMHSACVLSEYCMHKVLIKAVREVRAAGHYLVSCDCLILYRQHVRDDLNIDILVYLCFCQSGWFAWHPAVVVFLRDEKQCFLKQCLSKECFLKVLFEALMRKELEQCTVLVPDLVIRGRITA